MARTKGWTWDIPYCVACKRHILATERILLASLGFGAMSVVGSLGFAVLTGRFALCLDLLGLMVGANALLCLLLLRIIRGRCHANCRGLTRSVVYIGSNGPCHTFDIKSRFYAKDFILANHRKIVNASTSVASILRGVSFGDYQVPRRIFRPRD